MKIDIIFYKATSVIDQIICFFTRGKYCHVAIKIDDDLYQAAPFKKVEKILATSKDNSNADIFPLFISPTQKVELIEFLNEQLGKSYDYLGVLGFVLYATREGRKKYGKWFCSELVFAAFEKINIKLLRRANPWKISPVMLGYSPLLY